MDPPATQLTPLSRERLATLTAKYGSPGPRLRLLLVRHAQSANNAQPIPCVCAVRDPVLTDRGIGQAKAAGAAVRDLAVPDLVFASTLNRAMATAALIFREAPIYVAPFVNERGKGFEPRCVWGNLLLHPGSIPSPAERNINALASQLPDCAPRIDWRYVGGGGSQEAAWPRHPSWPAFVEWLWEQPAVAELLERRGDAATVALVTHGNLLEYEVLPSGHKLGHPKNAAVLSATLCRGSTLLRDVEVLHKGGSKSP